MGFPADLIVKALGTHQGYFPGRKADLRVAYVEEFSRRLEVHCSCEIIRFLKIRN